MLTLSKPIHQYHKHTRWYKVLFCMTVSHPFMQSTIWVNGCCVPETLRRKKHKSKHWTSACSHTSLPLDVRLVLLNQNLWLVSSYIWPRSSSSKPKVGQSRSIRVLYTLWLGLSLLGHERVLREETLRCYVCDCHGWKKELLYVCVLCVRHYHIHRWRAI